MAWGGPGARTGNVSVDVTMKDPIAQKNLTGNTSAFYLWANLTGPGTNVKPNHTSYIQQFDGSGKKVIADPIPATDTNLGDPASNFWRLTISADKALTSPAVLSVSFPINPLATVAGGGAQDVLTDANGDPLSAGTVLSRVLGAITVGGGVATLAPVDPFPVGTEYHVDTAITYGVIDAAGVVAPTPEPASAWLRGLAALGLFGYAANRAPILGGRTGLAPGRPTLQDLSGGQADREGCERAHAPVLSV
jgi:hypothetical protein